MKNNVLGLILIYFFGFLFFSIIFFLSFHLPLFSSENVLFYRGIKLLIVSAVLFLMIILFVKKRLIALSWETIFALVIFSFSFHLVFFVIFPVTFERSITMFLLNKVNYHQGIGKERLEKILIEEYILKNKALEKRIKEQKEIGFFNVKNNGVFLTKKAKIFLTLSLLIKKIYGVK